MMKIVSTIAATTIAISFSLGSASAGQRYATPPPLVLSPDLSQPMMLQLRGSRALAPRVSYRRVSATHTTPKRQTRRAAKQRYKRSVATRRSGVTTHKKARRTKARRQFDPALVPTVVAYSGGERAGTVIINTPERRLYLVMGNGKARRYGVGVGKPGFEWAGVHKVTRKAEWPSWRPPVEMIAREKAKGRNIPAYMAGGPNNPLGSRAMYLGSTLYRIHGSNQPWSIGKAVSSGCIRMRNQDAIDLYERVKVGAKVIVL